jgi:hypothetical protein
LALAVETVNARAAAVTATIRILFSFFDAS